MRLGLLGSAEGDAALVRKASEYLLERGAAEQVVYLGSDEAASLAVKAWGSELVGFVPSETALLTRFAQLACRGTPAEIEELLARDQRVQKLSAIRCLPAAPTRAVEMFEGKVVLLVHDKAQLDAEDIANAFLVVYGRSKNVALNHFGPRTFFSPGPLKSGQVGLIERQGDGQLAIARYDFVRGELLGREALEINRAKMVVQS